MKQNSSISLYKLSPLFGGDNNENVSLLDKSWFMALYSSVFELIPGALLEYKHACCFLQCYQNTPNSFRTYRRNVESYLLWCWRVKASSATSLRQADALEYIRFLANPEPEATWVGKATRYRFEKGDIDAGPHPEWRPIDLSRRKNKTGTPDTSKSSKVVSFGSLSSLYKYFIEDAEIAELNPFLSSRKRGLGRVKQTTVIDRLMTDDQMHYLAKASRAEGVDSYVAARKRFMVSMLYYLGVRISEISTRTIENWGEYMPVMSDFRQINGHWFFHIPEGTAKGGKERDVPLSPQLLSELKVFRTAISVKTGMDISVLPTLRDPIPLFPNILKSNRFSGSLSARQLSIDLKGLLVAAQRLMKEDIELLKSSHQYDAAENLARDADGILMISPHWLRHKCATDELSSGANPVNTQLNLGHSSLNTTTIYVHSDLDSRAIASGNKKSFND